jgi:hypothetical protein
VREGALTLRSVGILITEGNLKTTYARERSRRTIRESYDATNRRKKKAAEINTEDEASQCTGVRGRSLSLEPELYFPVADGIRC